MFPFVAFYRLECVFMRFPPNFFFVIFWSSSRFLPCLMQMFDFLIVLLILFFIILICFLWCWFVYIRKAISIHKMCFLHSGSVWWYADDNYKFHTIHTRVCVCVCEYLVQNLHFVYMCINVEFTTHETEYIGYWSMRIGLTISLSNKINICTILHSSGV